MNRRHFLASAAIPVIASRASAQSALRAGAAAADITPPLGASLAGNFTEAFSTDNHDQLAAKALVLDNGHVRVALVLCDLCVITQQIAADAKARIAEATGLPAANVLLCCTHTHSAPTAYPVFQSKIDPRYAGFLVSRIADSVRMAIERLAPARIGYGFGREDSLIFNRRFYMKEGGVPPNPFGGIDKVRMNPGAGNPDILRPAGPVDPTVGVLAVVNEDGSPLCVVGNYSLHYVGGQGRGHVSADYFAYWANAMARYCGVERGLSHRPFIAMLTNGCQGDINNIDVRNPAPRQAPYEQMTRVADKLAAESFRVMKSLRYSSDATLGASLELLDLGVRRPSADDVAAARRRLDAVSDGPPFRRSADIYARETILLSETFPERELASVQALNIGGLALAGISGEPFVEIGLALRRKSPFKSLMPIGLANGHVGYLPTVEAHQLGGYETWRAKTSYLEVEAAPKVEAAMLRRLSALQT